MLKAALIIYGVESSHFQRTLALVLQVDRSYDSIFTEHASTCSLYISKHSSDTPMGSYRIAYPAVSHYYQFGHTGGLSYGGVACPSGLKCRETREVCLYLCKCLPDIRTLDAPLTTGRIYRVFANVQVCS